ncbi:hypothetical protein F5Y14DRAFT_407126 [Nemania sp. NC0429]|nr:hypothetical protein F5Y14DRAFT_407126 [Nemania sp. NC0429]
MSSIKVLKTLSAGKGIKLTLNENEGVALDSVDRYFTEAITDGVEAFKVPPHWHKQHDELMTVVEGRAKITLNGKETIVKAGDAPVLVARRVVHSVETFVGERAVIQERPSPGGDHKIMFFNDMFSEGPTPGFWHLMRVFYDGDGYIVLPVPFRVVDQIFISVFGSIAHLFAGSRPKTL